jgi:uncharacterized protein YbjT (DUF2867 family)
MAAYLVVGGSGRTGRRVVDLLAEAGHRVIVASRRPKPQGGVETTQMDLSNTAGLTLPPGIDGIVISVEPPVDAAGADAIMNRGVAALAALAAKAEVQVVLVSQIYVTRGREHPDMAGIIEARARGEAALRTAGAPYTIVRPSWLTDGPAGGVRLEQGDTGDGRISRDAVAQASVAALFTDGASGKTFELYDAPNAPAPDWPVLLGALTPDGE